PPRAQVAGGEGERPLRLAQLGGRLGLLLAGGVGQAGAGGGPALLELRPGQQGAEQDEEHGDAGSQAGDRRRPPQQAPPAPPEPASRAPTTATIPAAARDGIGARAPTMTNPPARAARSAGSSQPRPVGDGGAIAPAMAAASATSGTSGLVRLAACAATTASKA